MLQNSILQNSLGFLGGGVFPGLANPGDQYRQQFGINSNYCPCCGAPSNRMQNAGIGLNQLAALSALRPPRKPLSEKELKDRFKRLSHEIDTAVERYGLAS